MKLKHGGNIKLKELEVETGRFCFDTWRSPQHGRLLVLAGGNGVGKTHCAKSVRDWIRTVGPQRQFVPRPNVIGHLDCIYWPWAQLLDALKNGSWDLVVDLFTATVLIIDDLGAGHDPSGIGTDKLCQTLSRRETKWTLITTNIAPGDWKEKFDNRVASRLFRNATLVDLSGVPDYCV